MSIDVIIRIIGLIVFCLIGVFSGLSLGEFAVSNNWPGGFSVIVYATVLGIIGAVFGLILTPNITIRPFRAIRSNLSHISAQDLLAAMIGLIVGLIGAALLTFPLSLLPNPFGSIMPFVAVLLMGYTGVSLFVMRQKDMFNLFSSLGKRNANASQNSTSADEGWVNERNILLDTSVIIDGRIADIAHTGFLPGTLLIPRFVLTELQYIADSPDSLRRQRGRRGMEVLSNLQKETAIPVRISDIDVEGSREVDDKLIILARQLRCPVLTNDYNLNRVAELQGVSVLNVNELANAVKSVLLPGEALSVRVIQEGKESGQGVGYMDDGTMVVVENGREYLHQEIHVMVTKVLQTAAGRMIFARPSNDH